MLLSSQCAPCVCNMPTVGWLWEVKVLGKGVWQDPGQAACVASQGWGGGEAVGHVPGKVGHGGKAACGKEMVCMSSRSVWGVWGRVCSVRCVPAPVQTVFWHAL